MTKTMTEGNPTKLILSFAVPLLLGNLLQQTYNMIDAAIVGQVLGTDSLAAVGASSSVQFLVMGFCIGVCAGFAVPIARFFGANDFKKLKNYIYNGSALAILLAVILTCATCLCCTQILNLLKTPSDIFDDAYNYLFIMFCGIPFCILYNYLASMLRSLGDSKTPFMFLAISTVLNIGLDFAFVVWFKWGCAGAALATISSQAMSGISCFIYFKYKYTALKLKKEDKNINKRSVVELITMGVPMGLQFSITAIGVMVLQSANNHLGAVYVSAYTAGNKLKQFAMCPFDAIATGVSVFVSQNLGAGKTERIKTGILRGIAVAATYGVLIGLVLVFFGRDLAHAFVKAKETKVLDAVARFTFVAGIFFWMLSVLAITRMTIQGLGYAGVAIFSGVLEMIARISVAKIFVPKMGFDAVCFTDQTAWTVAMIYCVIVCIICVKKATNKVKRKHEDLTSFE